jgi:hypothetical protein
MYELCDLTGERWSCLPDHLMQHPQNAVLVEKLPQRDHSAHSANLGWGAAFLPPSTLFAVPQRAGLPFGRELQYLDSEMQETNEISDYMLLFFEDFFLLFFFAGIYVFTNSSSFNLP